MEDQRWDWAAARRRCVREARRVLRNRDDAEEAAQEALLRAWRSRDSCRTPARADGWLAEIARNEAYRLMARRRRADERERANFEPPRDDGITSLIDEIALRQTLGELSPIERNAMELRYIADLTQAEIARRLQVPEGTVKVRLHRARNSLRAAIEGST
jgi:RNA polymerase sigma-70 factor, ECF subfamily